MSADEAYAAQQRIAELFDRFDADGDGTIGKEELGQLLRKMDPSAAWADKLDAVLDAVDLNRDGRVDFEEFLAWIFKGDNSKSVLEGALARAETVSLEPAPPEPYEGPRWMLHDRRSKEVPRTSLRILPTDAKEYKPQSAMNGEVVEVFGTSGKYRNVRLALSRTTGWLHERYLHECPEGAAGAAAAAGGVERQELRPHDGRLKELRKFLRRKNTTRKGGDVRAERAWLLKGHFLGPAGLEGAPKETLFFGCKDSWVDPVADGGFGAVLEACQGDFGKGLHLSPQSCKAFASCENYMFVCEAALGSLEERWTLEVPNPKLDYSEVCQREKKLSVQCHAGPRFDHEQRVVYDPAQCKPVYLLKLEFPGDHSFSESLKSHPFKDLVS